MKIRILIFIILITLIGIIDNSSATHQNISYLISVFDTNYIYTSTPTIIYPNGTVHQLSPLATATISPDSSWYRPNPNTYQNTTVITIKSTRTNIMLKFNNEPITVSNATRTSFEAARNYNQSYVLINNTIPEMANKNLSFKVDRVVYANIKADSNGFVSINYTDNFSKHTFEWLLIENAVVDVNQDGLINIADLDFIRNSIIFFIPCSICDVDTNGVVDLYDIMLVSAKISG